MFNWKGISRNIPQMVASTETLLNTEYLSQTSGLVICHQPDTSVFYFVCSQKALRNMGRPWNIQEAIYSSTVIWAKNGEKENTWAKWDSREEKYSDIIFSAQPIFEEIRLSRKQVSLHPECKPNLAPWTESRVTAMCFPNKTQSHKHAENLKYLLF